MPTRFALPARLIDLAKTVELRSEFTYNHELRVTGHAIDIAEELGLHREHIERLAAAARVHDVGKIAVPVSILDKPAALTHQEETIMQTHPVTGATMVSLYLPELEAAIRGHHERWDGTGYPDRLRGTEIPLEARILAVADTWDALTSNRPYRRGLAKAEAQGILQSGRWSQWDGDMVDVFLHVLKMRKRRPSGSGVLVVTPLAGREVVA